MNQHVGSTIDKSSLLGVCSHMNTDVNLPEMLSEYMFKYGIRSNEMKWHYNIIELTRLV